MMFLSNVEDESRSERNKEIDFYVTKYIFYMMSKKYPNSKSILKIHLKPKNCVRISTYFDFVKTLLNESLNVNLLFHKSSNILLLFTYSVQHL